METVISDEASPVSLDCHVQLDDVIAHLESARELAGLGECGAFAHAVRNAAQLALAVVHEMEAECRRGFSDRL